MTNSHPGGAPQLQPVEDGAERAAVPVVARSAKRLRPYDPTTSLGKIHAKPKQKPFKLDWNESTVPPSPCVTAALESFLRSSHHGGLHWYPELYSRELQRSLAGYTGLTPEHLLVTNGSDDALALVCNTFLDPADEVVVPTPTYTHFLVFAQADGGRIVPVRYDNPFEMQIDRVLQAITPRTKLIYLVSPNNPTGLIYGPEEVERVLDHAPHAVVIVDEAYHEFCDTTAVDLARSRPNLVVTRTFSKSFGLAGLRVGYLAAMPEMIMELKRLFNPKSVNVMGQVAATAALADIDYLRRYVAEVNASKPMLVDFFRERGFEARSTPANFVLARLPEPKRFCAALEEEGVYVRDRSSIPHMSGYVRLGVGTREQTAEVLERLRRAIGPCGRCRTS